MVSAATVHRAANQVRLAPIATGMRPRRATRRCDPRDLLTEVPTRPPSVRRS
ncbi:hypothetical protein ACFY2Q_10720 [Micromonospora sp. NPDC000316]|uniref:hypothetical protein n=1 Tax=Micromonospora sp. NPDC000316 TaxID=3364216 RepID=UPI0036B54594